MSYYDSVYEYAADNYGLITSTEAKTLGVPNIELVKLARRGRLVHLWHGVYRIERYVPTAFDKYAEAVAITGEGAYIFGESALAMHGLAFVNPVAIYVATPRRIRKKLPQGIVAIFVKNPESITKYQGIPSQTVFDALLACQNAVMSERLSVAVTDARRQGLITDREAEEARKEIRHARKSI